MLRTSNLSLAVSENNKSLTLSTESNLSRGARTSSNTFSEIQPYNTTASLSSSQPIALPQDAGWMRKQHINTAPASTAWTKPELPKLPVMTDINYKFPERVPMIEPSTRVISHYLLNEDYIKTVLPQFESALALSDESRHFTPLNQVRSIINTKADIQKNLRIKADKALKLYLDSYSQAVLQLSNQQLQALLGSIGAIGNPAGPDFDTEEISDAINNYIHSDEVHLPSLQFWSFLYGHRNLILYLQNTDLGLAVINNIEIIIKKLSYELDKNSREKKPDHDLEHKQQVILNIIQAFFASREGINPHAFCGLDVQEKSASETIAILLKNEGVIELLTRSLYGRQLLQQLEKFPAFIKLIKFNKHIEEINKKITDKEKEVAALRNQTSAWRLLNNFKISRIEKAISLLQRRKTFEKSIRPEMIIAQQPELDIIQKIKHAGVDSTIRSLLNKEPHLQDLVCSAINLNESTERVAPSVLANPLMCASFNDIVTKLMVGEKLRNALTKSDTEFYHAMTQLYPNINQLMPAFNRHRRNLEQQALLLATGALFPTDLRSQERKQLLLNLTAFLSERSALTDNDPALIIGEYLKVAELRSASNAKYLDAKTLKEIVTWHLKNNDNEKFYTDLKQSLKADLKTVKLEDRYRKGISIDRNENEYLIKRIIQDHKQEFIIDEAKIKIKQSMLNYMLSQQKYYQKESKQEQFNLDIAIILDLWSEKLAGDLGKMGLSNEHIAQHHNDSTTPLVNMAMIKKTDHLVVLERALADLLITRNSLFALEDYFRDRPDFQQHADTVNTLVALMEKTLFNDAELLKQFQEQIDIMFNYDVIRHFINREFEKIDLKHYERIEAEQLSAALKKLHKTLLSFSPKNINIFFDNIKNSDISSAHDLKAELLDEISRALFEDYNSNNATTCTILSLLLHKMFSTGYMEEKTAGTGHQFLSELTKNLLRQMSVLMDKEIEKILTPYSGMQSKTKAASDNSALACNLIYHAGSQNKVFSTITEFIHSTKNSNTTQKLTQDELSELRHAINRHYARGNNDIDALIDRFVNLLRKIRNKEAIQSLSQAVNDYYFLLSLRKNCTKEMNASDINKIEQQLFNRVTERGDNYFENELKEPEASAFQSAASDFNANASEGQNPPLSDAQAFIQKVDKKHNLSDSLMYKINQFNQQIHEAIQEYNEYKRSGHKRTFNENMILAIRELQLLNHFIGEINARNSSNKKIQQDEINFINRNYESANKYNKRANDNYLHDLVSQNASLSREIEWANKSIKKLNELKRTLGTPTTRYLSYLGRNMPIYMVFEDGDLTTRVVIRDARGKTTEHITLDGTQEPDHQNKYRVYVPIHPADYSEEKQKEVLGTLQKHLDEKNANGFVEPERETWTYYDVKNVPEVQDCKLVKVSVEERRATKLRFSGFDRYNRGPAPVKEPVKRTDLIKAKNQLVQQYINNPHLGKPPGIISSSGRQAIDYPDFTPMEKSPLPEAYPQLSPPPFATTDAMPVPESTLAAAQNSAPPPSSARFSTPDHSVSPYTTAKSPDSLLSMRFKSAYQDNAGLPRQRPSRFEKAIIPADQNRVPSLQPFRHLLDNVPTRGAALNPPMTAAAESTGAITSRSPQFDNFAAAKKKYFAAGPVSANPARPATARPVTLDDEKSYLIAQRVTLAEVNAPDFNPTLSKSFAIEGDITPARKFIAIENDPFATGTGHANCLIASLVMHSRQDYDRNSKENLDKVAQLRHMLIKNGKGKEGDKGYISSTSESARIVINTLNSGHRNNNQPELRVFFHDYVRMGAGDYIEFVDAIGPDNGREVHILGYDAHFRALIKP